MKGEEEVGPFEVLSEGGRREKGGKIGHETKIDNNGKRKRTKKGGGGVE